MNNFWQGHYPYRQQHWQNNSYPFQPEYPPQTQSPAQPYNTQSWNRRISIYDAMEIANQQVPGEIVKVELEREQGILVYEVEIMTQEGVKYEIDINAETGNVLSVELD